ncbi:hypothetical protein [Devosia submarina]|uniref:hypothetical protein n=1 Tax=Devosia submarina TaxID=1173082 RepID=UPI0013009AFE|nr:hypothetical protein [Devosia submarina]
MTLNLSRQTMLAGSTILALLGAVGPVLAQDSVVEGVFALPGVAQAVMGQLNVVETGPLTRRIELIYADKASGEQIAGYDVELTQQLHILATDAGLTHLIHEHADVVGDDGRFTAELEFPAPGLYHIYTDAVPTGIGQQVMRFDVTISEAASASEVPRPAAVDVSTSPLVSSDGPYSVTLDAAQLKPGVESAVSLLVEKHGEPAADLEPYLGVSAHAVFIRAEDLAYVHAHAMGAGAEGGHDAHGAKSTTAPSEPARHDHGGDESSHGGHEAPDHTGGHDAHGDAAAPAAGHDSHDSHDSHDAAATEAVDPNMSLHVTPPAAGVYALWIEFIGGDEIRTVPFTIEIPEAHSHASH